MKEVQFLNNNSEKWKKFESQLSQKSNPRSDENSDTFIEILDDLSYAKTYYPKGKTHQYLNSISASVQQKIYKNNKETWQGIVDFWKRDLPLIYSTVQKELLVSLLIMLLGVAIGFLSAANDDTFVRLILGDGYVNMTESNIEQGNPMAVYQKSRQSDMFFGITFNNIVVSFYAFVLGIFFSIGTAYVIFTNAIMLGSFHAFFYQKGMFWETFLTIWIHGSLEISAIVIAGAAGFVLSRSFMFPGTYSRKDAFLAGGKKGIRMISGLIPIFITAGFLESFVTRYHEMNILIKLIIITGSLSYVLWFFVINPRKVKAKFDNEKLNELI
ncbi:MAG: stage II sporulation protein M [Chlorobiota bacterium]